MKTNFKFKLSAAIFGVGLILAVPAASAEETSNWCHTFKGTLRPGIEIQTEKSRRAGDDSVCRTGRCLSVKEIKATEEIRALQIALEKEDFAVASSERQGGVGEFGNSTADAVSGFQQKYKTEILDIKGLKYGTGYVEKDGPTFQKLNALYGCPIIKLTASRQGKQIKVGRLYPGDKLLIEWTPSTVADVFLVDSANKQTEIAKAVKTPPGAPSWTVPETIIPGTYRISLKTQSITVFSDPFEISGLITINSPRGGESWLAGSRQQIIWAPSQVAEVLLVNSQGTATSLKASAISPWKYWEIPTGQAAGAYKIRLKIGDKTYDSQPFNIVSETYKVTEPKKDALWIIGQQYPIKWVTSKGEAPTANADIVLVNASDHKITSAIPGATSLKPPFNWTIGDTVAVGKYHLGVKVGSELYVGNATVEIDKISSVEITEPEKNVVWTIGKQYKIKWTVIGSDNKSLNVPADLVLVNADSHSGEIAIPKAQSVKNSFTLKEWAGITAGKYHLAVKTGGKLYIDEETVEVKKSGSSSASSLKSGENKQEGQGDEKGVLTAHYICSCGPRPNNLLPISALDGEEFPGVAKSGVRCNSFERKSACDGYSVKKDDATEFIPGACPDKKPWNGGYKCEDKPTSSSSNQRQSLLGKIGAIFGLGR
jgi:peptidoglycan hydrolase-like protein with peptidoglycan-binding domain